MTFAAAGNAATATRIINAHINFVSTIANCGNISTAEAEKVAAYYLKNKIAKLDAVIGRISVKHGAFLEADVILRAVPVA